MTEAREPSEIILSRLEEQIAWYDCKSLSAQLWYKRLKLVSLVSAALIPFLSTLGAPSFLPAGSGNVVVGLLGIVITVSEGLQHMNQHQHNWNTYRSTCEALRHEKIAYFARLGEYANAPNPPALLADRMESLISTEHSKWIANQQPQEKEKT